MRLIFIQPLTSVRGLAELLVKGTPLILIAIGLAVGFRGGVWNIGAEGQFTIGALAGGAVALAFYPATGWWLLPLMSLAGIAGGAAWAAIPALLRTRFNANEILVSLMLVYVAVLLLSSLVHGALRDPDGLNFPESRLFQTALPILIDGTRAHVGFLVALVAVGLSWLLLERHFLGFKIKVLGQAPRAARFGGFSDRQLIWFCFLRVGRMRWAGGPVRGGGSGRAAGAGAAGRLRLHRHHRRLPGPAASRRHPVRRAAAGAHLHRRRDGADLHEPAQRHHRRVPGHVPVLPARRRRAGELPPALDIAQRASPVTPPPAPAKPSLPQPAPAHSVEH